jgi:hypothetical protein
VLGAQCPTCTAYWYMCQGKGSFTVDAAHTTVSLQLPPGCNGPAHTLVFGMSLPPGGFPPKANLQVDVTDNGNGIVGYRYPPSQCDAPFTMCGNPFQ